jgi:hypothetical protein
MSALRLRAYGRTVEIRGDDPLLRLARERLPSTYRTAAEQAERVWSIDRNGEISVDDITLSRHDDRTAAAEAMLSNLELWVAENASRAVFIHAGCVVADGRAIVMPGYSLDGKTTLTAALVRAGAEYYSDEFAVLDHRGDVRPYPRPLSVRIATNSAERVTAEGLGGRVGRGSARVGLIAALRYDPRTGFAVESRMESRAALLLVPHAVPSRPRPRATLNAITRATSGAVAIVGTRGDADEAAVTLLETLRSYDVGGDS